MRSKKVYILWTAVLLLAGTATAQITQTGTINGVVYDQERQPLPGVTVTIQSPALILPQMEMVTTEAGNFRFPALPPGAYKVTFKLQGFRTLVREGIRVAVGVTTTIDINLEQSAIEESVTVTGQSPTVDVQKTTMVASLTTEFLQSIPAARNLGAFFAMVAGVSDGTTHGSSERDNTFNIDGVNVTDPVTGTQAGTFGLDIMEELSVQTGGLPAEYGSVRGGVINVVTKSGGNRVNGTASFYYRNKNLQTTNTKGTVFEGQAGGFEYEVEPVLAVGGPIIKDKLWFFGNFSFNKSEEIQLGYPYDTQPTNTPLDYYRIYPYGKLTFQLSRKDKVVLSFNFSDYQRNHRGAAVTRTVDSTWKQTTPIYTYNLQYTRLFNSNFFFNFKTAFMNYHLNLMAKNDKPQIYDSILRQYTQSYGYDDIYSRDRFQVVTDATYFVDSWVGRHEFKAGGEFEFSSDSRYRRHNLDPKTGLGPFFTYKNGVPDYVTYYQDFTRKDQKIAIGGFIQDTWSPIARLTLNLGVRFDHQEGIIPVQGEDREAMTYGGKLYDPRVTKAFKPLIWNTLAPRLGATYDITGDGKTAFKVSFSRYYIANILQWFVTVNPNSFISYRYRLNPDGTPKGSLYNFSATAEAQMDPDLKSPYLDEFTIGLEREIIRDLRVGARYIHKWDRNLLEGVDLNALDLDALMGGAELSTVWTNFTPVQVIDPYDGQPVPFWKKVDTSLSSKAYYTNPPGADRDYDGVEVTIDKRFSNNWQFNASYVWQKSRGLIGTDFDDSWSGQSYFDDPNMHTNALGDFSAERRNQIKIQGLWRGPFGIDLSAYFRRLDGNRYTRLVRSQDLGLTLPQGNWTVYAEKRGSRVEPVLTILDLRVEKAFNLPKSFGRLSLFADIFNVFNVNTATSIQSTSSSTLTVNNQPVKFGGLTDITDPRVARLGVKIEF
ncbi:MAG: TonB-dependent receptor [Candidatus Aminicenantes bacterium]|nr:TonB-dependent receptor [Candidatus Aminicenantes bacterium]